MINRFVSMRFTFAAILACSAHAMAGAVHAFDGQTLKGTITLHSDSTLSIATGEQPPPRLDLSGIFDATFNDRLDNKPMRCGVMLRDGGAIAADHISSIDADGKNLLMDRHGENLVIPLDQIARVIFRPVAQTAWVKAPAGHVGALLDNGDFFEGDLKSLNDGDLRMSSVLFGISRFDTESKALAVILNELQPGVSNWIVRFTDGTIVLADTVQLGNDRLTARDSSNRLFSAPVSQLLSIRCGDKRLDSLVDQKPRLDPPDDGAYNVDNVPVANVALRLAGASIAHGISLSAGASATFALDGKYQALVFRAGVPADMGPFAQVRFRIFLDGRMALVTRDKSSIDEATFFMVQLAGAKELTIKAESDLTADLGAIGLLGDPFLVKVQPTTTAPATRPSTRPQPGSVD